MLEDLRKIYAAWRELAGDRAPEELDNPAPGVFVVDDRTAQKALELAGRLERTHDTVIREFERVARAVDRAKRQG